MEKLIIEGVDRTNNPNKFALFIGRWQPFHDGHQWLIDQKLKKGINVCIAIRDVPKDDKNWWTSDEIKTDLEERFKNEIEIGIIKLIQIPDIESINIGRGVGYDIIEHVPPQDIHDISATKIRQNLKEKNNQKIKEPSPLKRHILKTISYRLLSTSIMILTTYLLGMDLKISAIIGIGELVFKPIIYFIHERFWYKYISIGRKKIK